MMSFKEELQLIKKSRKSPKLEKVKEILKDAAFDGENHVTLSSGLYDEWIIHWFETQDIDVEEISDSREGNYLRVAW